MARGCITLSNALTISSAIAKRWCKEVSLNRLLRLPLKSSLLCEPRDVFNIFSSSFDLFSSSSSSFTNLLLPSQTLCFLHKPFASTTNLLLLFGMFKFYTQFNSDPGTNEFLLNSDSVASLYIRLLSPILPSPPSPPSHGICPVSVPRLTCTVVDLTAAITLERRDWIPSTFPISIHCDYTLSMQTKLFIHFEQM